MQTEYARGFPEFEAFEDPEAFAPVVGTCATFELGELPHAAATSASPITHVSAGTRKAVRLSRDPLFVS
jgi:hypothetical protein